MGSDGMGARPSTDDTVSYSMGGGCDAEEGTGETDHDDDHNNDEDSNEASVVAEDVNTTESHREQQQRKMTNRMKIFILSVLLLVFLGVVGFLISNLAQHPS